jgi:hypothetical protein
LFIFGATFLDVSKSTRILTLSTYGYNWKANWKIHVCLIGHNLFKSIHFRICLFQINQSTFDLKLLFCRTNKHSPKLNWFSSYFLRIVFVPQCPDQKVSKISIWSQRYFSALRSKFLIKNFVQHFQKRFFFFERFP